MAGRSSLALKAREFGVDLDEKSPELKGLIEELKEREFRGYEYEAADASFKLLVARKLGHHKELFEVEGYRVIVERHGAELWSEATVRVKVGGESIATVAEASGPIGALDKALRLGLEKTFPQLRDMKLRDYKVRILESNEGTGSKTRVLVESGDGHSIWGTVGVSDNIIDASWEALREAVEYRLSAPPQS
jgi:2-isopropylmalate synthase